MILPLLLSTFAAFSTAHPVRYGTHNYTQYLVGSPGSRLVLSAPHEGYKTPDNIANRTYGCWNGSSCTYRNVCPTGTTRQPPKCKATTVTDLNTAKIANLLSEEIGKLNGGVYPHLVISELKRTKMDPNRDVEQGAFGEPDAVTAWTDYHGFIQTARSSIDGPGLVLDIHGQGHPEEWIELGYLLRSSTLDSGDYQAVNTSIRALAARTPDSSLNDLLYGPQSLGAFLQNKGYKTVPSPMYNTPQGGKYYSGGYITKMYGSREGGEIDAIQIESPRSLRGDMTWQPYARQLAQAIVQFMDVHYKDDRYTTREDGEASEQERATTTSADSGDNDGKTTMEKDDETTTKSQKGKNETSRGTVLTMCHGLFVISLLSFMGI